MSGTQVHVYFVVHRYWTCQVLEVEDQCETLKKCLQLLLGASPNWTELTQFWNLSQPVYNSTLDLNPFFQLQVVRKACSSHLSCSKINRKWFWDDLSSGWLITPVGWWWVRGWCYPSHRRLSSSRWFQTIRGHCRGHVWRTWGNSMGMDEYLVYDMLLSFGEWTAFHGHT